MSKVLVGLFSGLMMVCSLGASAAASDPVGIVDYQKVGQSISFQELFKTKMEAAQGTSRQDIETLTKAMQEKQKQLTDKNAKLTEEQKKSLNAAIAEQTKKLSAMQAEASKKMMDVRANLAKDLKQKLDDVMGQIAAKHNLSVVFVNASLAYASNKLDITDELVTELAKALGVKPVSPAAQVPAGMPARSMTKQ